MIRRIRRSPASSLSLALIICLLSSTSFVSAQVGFACPRGVDFWLQQCGSDGTCPTTVCRAGMESLWRCVITETDVIQWNNNDGSQETTASLAALSNANLLERLCSQLQGPPVKTTRDQAESQYLALLLNVCVGALPLDVQVSTKGFTGTVASAIDAIENALNTNTNLDFWRKAAEKINHGNGGNASDCPDPDSLFGNVPPCGL